MIPEKITNIEEMDALIKRLNELREEARYCEFDVKIGEG